MRCPLQFRVPLRTFRIFAVIYLDLITAGIFSSVTGNIRMTEYADNTITVFIDFNQTDAGTNGKLLTLPDETIVFDHVE